YPSKESDVVTRSLERRRQQTVADGASPAVLKIINASSKGLSPGQKGFIRWMMKLERDPLDASAMDIMNYLAHGLEVTKWRLETARVYKSSVLQLLSVERRQEITANNDFQEFLKVMGTDSFKRLRNYDIDLGPLMEHLRSLGDNHNMSFVDLTEKNK
ncbi:hypothetical protein BGX26_008426, partial [Mortierella sp. AD094]